MALTALIRGGDAWLGKGKATHGEAERSKGESLARRSAAEDMR